MEEYKEKSALTIEGLLNLYQADGITRVILEALKKNAKSKLQLKGLKGSLDAIISASVIELIPQSHFFVLHDKEEASYFFYDLKNLLPGRNILFFPTSYKKPYQFQEVENANVLQRAEVLSQINRKKEGGDIIVSYPEALTEKVINQRSLLENTFSAKVGEKVNTEFISELLTEYEFEKEDFVYEAGQFAVRGGIIDIFSYANELPFRLELFGDEIESIKTFDPLTQLSISKLDQIAIIPNVQTKLMQEVRESILSFIPSSTKIWVKDYELTLDTISKNFSAAQSNFDQIVSSSGDTQIINDPGDLFESQESFEKAFQDFSSLEFGNRFYHKKSLVVNFESKSQPSFNKDFNLLVEDLDQNELNGYQNVLVAESHKQLERLKTIFAEIDPGLNYSELNISLKGGFIDDNLKLVCYTDHQIFERFHKYYVKKKFSKTKALTLKDLRELKIGDFVTHIEHGIGRFGGLEKVVNNEKEQEAVRLIYRDDDILFVGIHGLHKISKYSGQEGRMPPISKLGSQEWEQKKRKVKKRVQDIAKDLINLYAKRKTSPGFAFTKDSYLQAELESSFIYEDTPDQAKATEDVKADMELPHPMDRLVCGDVGFGKTEVAIRSAFKAVCDSKQVAVLVPTTILAMQHYKTFKDRFSNLPCKVDYLNRFRTPSDVKRILKELKEGKIDVLIGTHKITGKAVEFKDLGLMVIDEEQKFGVKTKERLKEMTVNVDVLTLTATPIPRTLQFSLMGARDLSVISTPPPNRQPVETNLHTFSDEVIRDAVRRELNRGGQVFFVHNRIGDIESIANNIVRLVPDARVVYAHGQMEGQKLEKLMVKFIDGEYDVLVSTNIIESGLDIPNANTIIINRAHMFGLSDLHQMRGRVGRSNRKAYCYLITPSLIHITPDARKRLSTLEEFSDLGDGFKVAMRDLDIRGAGNLLGAEQSGFISDLGFDMYNKILEDAITELKETEFRELFVGKNELDLKELKVDCNIETDFEVIIPESYVSNISERLNLYIAADAIKNAEELEKFRSSLSDRFGPIPTPVFNLLEVVKLRWICESLGIEKLILKGGVFKASLVEHNNTSYYQGETFGKFLRFVNKNPRKCQMKDAKKRVILIVNDVFSIDQALNCVQEIKS
ncbi:transcription-repair coupling factor [Flexithrix dorotheae]|uniref:transcription-repair coupling factor n=1 Tax=Flexithrix dorotheae TaxID=70993 RepID=UPI00037E54B1|nr:transcription-repair coupling factor [Flexithrix dorotheae]